MRLIVPGRVGLPHSDFVGAITENLNNSRFYSSLNKRVAHIFARSYPANPWTADPDYLPYFVWDTSFSALLASVEDSLQIERYDSCLARFSNAGWEDAPGLELEISRRSLCFHRVLKSPRYNHVCLENLSAMA